MYRIAPIIILLSNVLIIVYRVYSEINIFSLSAHSRRLGQNKLYQWNFLGINTELNIK